MSSSSRQQLEAWLKTLEVRGRVLDIGGSANTLEGRVKVFEPKEYLIMDNNAEKKYHEKWNKPDIEWDINVQIPVRYLTPAIEYEDKIELVGGNLFGFKKFIDTDGSEFSYEYFDQIFMIEVSEYLYNPLQVLKNVYRLLKHGGKFYSSWHFIYPKHQPEGQDLLRYTDWGVKKLHELVGFKNIKIIPRIAENNLASFYSAERMRAIKHTNHNVIGWLVEAEK